MMWPMVNGEANDGAAELNAPWTEGPAVLRLRMLELKFGLRSRRLTGEARRTTEQALRDMRQAVLDRPPHSFADLVAKLQTFREGKADRSAASNNTANNNWPDGALCPDETVFG